MYNLDEREKKEFHDVEIYPACSTSVENYSAGLMLNINLYHRILHKQNVLEQINEIIAKCKSQRMDYSR